MYTKLARIKNIKNLSIGTDRPMQTVQTQIRRRREQGNETNFGEQESSTPYLPYPKIKQVHLTIWAQMFKASLA